MDDITPLNKPIPEYKTDEKDIESFPRVGDLVEWVNLLEVWSNDKWVDDGGPYFDVAKWNASLVRKGMIIEISLVEDIFHWSVWDFKHNKIHHISSTTDCIRVLSRCEEPTLLGFYMRK